MALQELQVGVAGHQASKGIISTACHRVDQLLGGLWERNKDTVLGVVCPPPGPATLLWPRPLFHAHSGTPGTHRIRCHFIRWIFLGVLNLSLFILCLIIYIKYFELWLKFILKNGFNTKNMGELES